MPSLLHEAPLLLMEERPTLLLELLSQIGQTPPAFEELRLESADHSEVLTLEGRSDRIAVLYQIATDDSGARSQRPVLAIINESQRGVDEDKWWAWPFYHAAVRKKLRCPVWILVVALDPTVATWARRPVPHFHPGGSFAPLVVGPSDVPTIRDPAQARADPELAVLSALAHGNDEPQVLRAALEALSGLPRDKRANYEQMILAALGERGINILEEYWMQISEQQWAELYETTPFGKYFHERMSRIVQKAARKEGVTADRAQALLELLEDRGLPLSEADRTRILGCHEFDTLHLWFKRALRATSLAEVFAA